MKNVSLVRETNSLAVVIENIEQSNRKINYINSLFSYIECDIKTISKVNFNGKNTTIFFTLPCAKALFLENKHKIHNSIYNSLFIRTYLSIESVRRGRVLYHDTKANLIQNAKFVFDNKNSKYELRKLNKDTTSINWKDEPIEISMTYYNSWESSYEAYLKALKTLPEISKS